MDLSNANPVDEPRSPRDHSSRATPTADRASSQPTEAPGAEPVAGGPVASSAVQNGSTRDATAEQQTRDRVAALEDRLQEVAKRRNLPADRRLSIEVDNESMEIRVFVLDRDSGEVIRQIPEDELRGLMADAAKQGANGMLDHRV